MKNIVFVLFVLYSQLSLAQSNEIESLILTLGNDSLKTVASTPFLVERDSLGNVIQRRASIFSMDKDCQQLIVMGKEITPYLLKHLQEEDKDYVINLILYSIYNENAYGLMNYASPTKINEWKKYQRDTDFLFWEQKFK